VVAPGIGIPTGSVTFTISSNGTTLSSVIVPLTVINGVDEAVFTPKLASGTYAITAVYSGDPDFITSTSATYHQKVK